MSEENTEDSSNLSPKLRHAMGLITALCDDRITPEQFHELESLVCNDPEVGRFYVSIIHLDAALHHFAFYFAQPMLEKPDVDILTGEGIHDNGQASGMNETMVLPAMPQPQSVDTDELEEIYQPRSVSSDKTQPQTDRKRLPPYLKGGFAALLMLGVGLLGYALVSPKGRTPQVSLVRTVTTDITTNVAMVLPPTPVATLDLTVRPIWETADMPPHDGNFIAGQLLSLKSGDVQLSFHRGGRLVVEGPAELEFVSDTKISLHRGRIVATVPGGGLVVSCPMGSVTDLGTQFGLAVDSHGGTEVAVFQGRVSASLASTATTQSTKELLLNVGQAAVMTDKVLSLSPEGAVPQRFVCSLVNGDVTSLDVTDLVSGGDGTTHRRGIGINANTGEIGALPPTQFITSDGKYHRVNGYPVVNGVFVPDGRGAMDVDSAGDQFEFSPAGKSAFNNIYTGGKIPWPVTPEFSTVLDGVDYASPGHGIICVHPNNALTLDLDAVRRIHPDRVLAKFHCRVGNSYHGDPNAPGKAAANPVAAVYVLVDGVSHYENPHFTYLDGSFVIDVPLLKLDRFLTLASTDAGKGNRNDWILWTDAELDLSAAN